MATSTSTPARYGSVNLDAIRETFYVRTRLDLDHVQQLADLYKAGAKLPALKVTDSGVLVDGRHRLHALRLLGWKAASVEYVADKEVGELIGDALLSNVGGALPPTHTDITSSLGQMIESGLANSVIMKRLTVKWPHAVAKRYLDDAHSNLSKERVIRAMRAVTEEGKTVAEAALLHKVKLDALKLALGGKKRRKTTVAEFKGALEVIVRSRGQKIGALLRKAQAEYEEGQLTKKQLEELVDQAELSTKRAMASIQDWHKRLAAAARAEKAHVA